MEYFLRDSLWGTAVCFYLGNRVSVARELPWDKEGVTNQYGGGVFYLRTW